MGAPTKYDAETHDVWAWSLALEGKTNKEIAKAFGVAERTLNYWMCSNPGFLRAIKEGKELADTRVERSLYQRAIGYKIKRVHASEITNAAGEVVKKIKEAHEIEIPPDPTSCIFWLKNRKPQQWRDRKEIDSGIRVNGVELDMSDVFKEIDEKTLGPDTLGGDPTDG